MSTYAILRERYEQLQREIDAARESEIRLIVHRIREVLAEAGISLDELANLNAGRQQQPAGGRRVSRGRPKYMNPQTGQTWTGHGREPRWIAGRSRIDFLIPGAEKTHDRDERQR